MKTLTRALLTLAASLAFWLAVDVTPAVAVILSVALTIPLTIAFHQR